MANVGYATLSVIPSMKGIQGQLSKGIALPAQKAGAEGGKQAGNSLVKSLSGFGAGITDTISTWFKRGATIGIAGVTTLVGIGLTRGLKRALDREDAIVTFRRMGLDQANIDQLTDQIDKALSGTVVTNPEGFALAGRFLAQGFDEADIPGYVSTIADMASVGNRSFGEMADVMVAAAGAGRITAAELNRMGDIPLNKVAEELGMSESALRGLVSEGGLAADTFMDAFAAIEEFNDSAKDPTTRTAWSNFWTEIASTGEKFLAPLLGEGGMAQTGLLELRERLKEFGDNVIAPLGERFAAFLPKAMAVAGNFIQNRLVPAFENVRDAISDGLSWIRENEEALRKVADAVGPAALGLMAFAVGINLVTKAYQLMKIATPIGLILAIASALIYAWQNSEKFREIVTNAFNAVKEVLQPVFDAIQPVIDQIGHLWQVFSEGEGFVDGIRGVFESIGLMFSGGSESAGKLGDAFGNLWDSIKGAFDKIGPIVSEVWGFVQEKFEDARQWIAVVWEKIQEIIAKAVDAISAVITTWVGFISGIWDAFGDTILNVISTVWETIKSVFEAALDVIGGIFDIFAGVFTGDWERAWEGVKSIFGGVWDAIKSVLQGAIDVVKSIFTGFFDWIRGGWERFKEGAVTVWQSLLDWIKKVPGWIWDALVSLPGLLVDFGGDLIDGLWRGAKNIWVNVVAWFIGLPGVIGGFFSTVGTWLLEEGGKLISGMWDGISGWWSDTVVPWFLGLKDTIVGWFADAGRWLLEAGKNLALGLRDGFLAALGFVKAEIRSGARSIGDDITPGSGGGAPPPPAPPPPAGGSGGTSGGGPGQGMMVTGNTFVGPSEEMVQDIERAMARTVRFAT